MKESTKMNQHHSCHLSPGNQICLVSRADERFQRYASLAHAIGINTFEHLVERRLYCDVVNQPDLPANEVFWLRPAKPRELRRFDPSFLENQDGKIAAAFAELRRIVATSLPEQIANFRIVPSDEFPSQAALVNSLGEESAARELPHFMPKTSLTMKRHCLSLGGFVWMGPSRFIKPFYEFCLAGGPNLQTRLPEGAWASSPSEFL